MNSVFALDKLPLSEETNYSFIEEMLRQFRLQDQTGTYAQIPDDLLLESWFISSNSLVKNPRINLSKLQFLAFYQAVAKEIEKRTGKIAEPFLNIHQQKSCSALIFCGNLLVVYQLLEKLNYFAFDSLETLALTADYLIDSAVARIKQFF